MFDCDVLIIGGGPAGLTAGLYLGRANLRVVLLEKDTIGGPIRNVEWIENYPGFAKGISGAQLASEMVDQATKYGLRFEQSEATEIEFFSSCRVVNSAKGNSYTTRVVIIAGGSRPKKLGVPGEGEFLGKGVFRCALCDGGEFADRIVAVCGGGDSGLTEALYMTKIASRVIVIEALPALSASPILQERAKNNPKMEIHCGMKVEAIVGENQVKALELVKIGSNRKETLKVDGVLIHVGIDPNTEYLRNIIPLDNQGQIIVNHKMETEVPFTFAAGDIRSDTTRQIVSAVGDGANAAIWAQRLLQKGA